MTLRAAAPILAFQLVWLACAVGAGSGYSWPGIAAGLALAAGGLALSPSRCGMAATMLASAMIGLVAETCLLASGLARYSAHWPTAAAAPAWIVVLWLAFGSTVGSLKALIGGRPKIKAAVLGALLGPIAYVAGAGLGALSLPDPVWPSLAGTSAIWAAALPALIAVSQRSRTATTAAAPARPSGDS